MATKRQREQTGERESLSVKGIDNAEPIANAPPGSGRDQWWSDQTAERNAGRLLLRISMKGVKRFYFRYSVPGRDRIVMPLDVFTVRPRAGAMTLEQARERARELSALHRREESRDVRAYLEAQKAATSEAAAAVRARAEAVRAEAAAAEKYNVKALAAEYIAYLERKGKTRSAGDARNIFKNHLDGSDVASAPAREVHSRDVAALFRKLVDAGKGRTAAKFRSYLRAAYAVAGRAESDASAPAGFIAFRIEVNPVAETHSLADHSKTRDRYLDGDELVAYWKRLDAVTPEPVRAALKLAMLLGGQRVAQLLRLRRVDVDLHEGVLTLRDPKGRRKQARVHELPLSPQARAIVEPMLARAKQLESDWVFASDGKAAVYPGTLTGVVRAISAQMVGAGESPEPFKLSDLRRTAETVMASMGISSDVRAQIQSHGLGGVQQRNYVRHDYREEKRKALAAWARRLTGQRGKESKRAA